MRRFIVSFSIQKVIVKLVFKNISYYFWVWEFFLRLCENFLVVQPNDQPNSIHLKLCLIGLSWKKIKKNTIQLNLIGLG